MDFFFRVNSKITKDIKIPFVLDGIVRVDDTPVHKAMREALVNCLVNADFFPAERRGDPKRRQSSGF